MSGYERNSKQAAYFFAFPREIFSAIIPGYSNQSTVVAGFASRQKQITSSRAGCDSIVKLSLTINSAVSSVQNLTFCPNQLPTNWNGFSIPAGAVSKQGFAQYHTISSRGCDSTVTLNLEIAPSKKATQTVSLCASQLPLVWNKITIPAGAVSKLNYASFTTAGAGGCDSTVTLNLQISAIKTTIDTLQICADQLPVAWNNITIPASAASNTAYANFTTQSSGGCDSIVVLNLRVNNAQNSAENLSVCQSQLPFTWNGITIPQGAVAKTIMQILQYRFRRLR